VANLLKQHHGLADELLKQPQFISPANLTIAVAFNPEQKQRAARVFFDAVRKDGTFEWSPELVDLLGGLPANEVRPLLHKQWSDFSLRESILKNLSVKPDEADRDRFLTGLDSASPATIGRCIDALLHLPRDESPGNLVPVMKRLQTLARDNKAAAPWEKGNSERGGKIFQQRSCASCHTPGSRIAPDLTGAAGRFSRDDLFTAILNPSRDLAPAYRVNDIELTNGKRVSGMVIFESADGVIIQSDGTTTLRIATEEIASRKPSPKSLMPDGLLKDLKPEDLSDLYAYLKSLSPAQPKPK
jgi:putative heme-binding domain-containing protein